MNVVEKPDLSPQNFEGQGHLSLKIALTFSDITHPCIDFHKTFFLNDLWRQAG